MGPEDHLKGGSGHRSGWPEPTFSSFPAPAYRASGSTRQCEGTMQGGRRQGSRTKDGGEGGGKSAHLSRVGQGEMYSWETIHLALTAMGKQLTRVLCRTSYVYLCRAFDAISQAELVHAFLDVRHYYVGGREAGAVHGAPVYTKGIDVDRHAKKAGRGCDRE